MNKEMHLKKDLTLVLTSRPSPSTMNKVLEYMALNKPVVAFDLTETRYSCGDAAIYVRPNDVQELSEKLVELAGNPVLWEEMGRKGKERIENRLSWKYSIPYLESAYKHVFEDVKKNN